MTYSNSDKPQHGQKLLPFVLGGCVVVALCALPLCLLLGGAANAGYWIIRQPPSALAQEPSGPIDPAGFDSIPAGDSSAGEQIFTTSGCSACHSLDAGVRIVGPSISGILTSAATRKPGYTAEMYLYESIISPNAYVVAGFQSGIMPAEYADRLSDQQLADLVAFLMMR